MKKIDINELPLITTNKDILSLGYKRSSTTYEANKLIMSNELTKLYHGIYYNNKKIIGKTIWDHINNELEKGSLTALTDLLNSIFGKWYFTDMYLKTKFSNTIYNEERPSIYLLKSNPSKDSKETDLLKHIGLKVYRFYEEDIKVKFDPELHSLSKILVEYGIGKIKEFTKDIEKVVIYGIKHNILTEDSLIEYAKEMR